MSFGITTAGTGQKITEEVRIHLGNYEEGNSQLAAVLSFLENELKPDNEYILDTSGHKDDWSHFILLKLQKINRPRKADSAS